MDHAINDLKSRMESTIDLYSDIPKKEIEQEIMAYVKAINVLEEYYHERKITTLENALYPKY